MIKKSSNTRSGVGNEVFARYESAAEGDASHSR